MVVLVLLGQISAPCDDKSPWHCLAAVAVAGLGMFASIPVALSQDTGAGRDVQTSCLVANIPALTQLSLTWTGDCADGKASGVGNVFAFSGGELRYILRGRFDDGKLTRRDQMRSCANKSCVEQVAAVVLRAHAALNQRTQASGPASFAAVPLSAANLTPAPSSSAAAAGANGTGKSADIRAADAVYRGNFVVDPKTHLVSGDGRVEFVDGRVFIGTLEEGKRAGRGTYIWSSGERYVGDWRNDLQEGLGEWTSPKGDRYVGEYRLGKREGKGTMTYASKMQYEGAWLADQPSGHGTFRFPNGDVYEGQVVAGEQNGAGTLTQKNGDRYVGQWRQGKRDGRGVAEWNNRQRYEGDWRLDRKEGAGLMRFPDGGVYDGQWKDDLASGQASIQFASGDAYVGEVLDGQPHGKGVYKWGSGDKFEGEFTAGKPTDKGIMSFHDETHPKDAEVAAVLTKPADSGGSTDAPAAASKATLCSRGYNAARNVTALRRFIESFPDDECGRHALAKQKIGVLEENERKAAKEQLERLAQAKALIGLVVLYRQEFPYCVSGTGANCQQVVYLFDVKGKIKDVNLARQGVQVSVTDVVMLGNEKGAAAQLFAQGRAAALDTFRKRMIGTAQWKTKADVGLSF